MSEEKKVMAYEDLDWYQSTQGPMISGTVKSALTMMVIPVIQNLFGWHFDSAALDAVVDAVVMLVFGGLTIYNYAKAKKSMGQEIKKLKSRDGQNFS